MLFQLSIIKRDWLLRKENLKDNKLYGICNKIENNTIFVTKKGICDINVEGTICVGDKLTLGKIPGKAVAMEYNQDETQFDEIVLGKVIKLYPDYKIANILLNSKIKYTDTYKEIDELTDKEKEILYDNFSDWVKDNFKKNDMIIVFLFCEIDTEIETDDEGNETEIEIKTYTLVYSCLYRENRYMDIRGSTSNIENVLNGLDCECCTQLEFDSIEKYDEFLEQLENNTFEL